VSLFVWRLLHNRLSTKINVYKRGILQDDAQLCVAGCGQPESTEHLFTRCPLVGSLWSGILGWIGFQIVHPRNVSNHFLQFESLAGFSKSKRTLLTLIWCATSWTLWKERNNIIFLSKASIVSKFIDNVKLLSFWWLKRNSKSIAFDYHRWWLSLLSCMALADILFYPSLLCLLNYDVTL